MTLSSTGKLAPGGLSTAGTLSMKLGTGSLDVSAADAAANSQSLQYRIDAPGSSDKIALTAGSLNIGSGTLEFDDFAFSDLSNIQATSYSDRRHAGQQPQWHVQRRQHQRHPVVHQRGTDLLLSVTSTPEPSSLGLLAVGGTAMRRRCRRK